MLVKAQQKLANTTPRKLRLVADMVRRLPITQAQEQLKFATVRTAAILGAVLNQAVANATQTHKLAPESLRIKAIDVDEGRKYKRWQAVSRGRAHGITKRTTHIRVVVEGEPDGTKS
ncbi:MAG: 50S ribosomal protein L22 [Candidatus Chisholmbacteria bacterium RIFCSPHIGHO2_01_FULL_48_12]|uniref:Large ribosomal subunit protein uL22 n=1 Tax=Candidatus Chisholmbacteria bacterium RIFCSPHIGHO2_01_FULL_48_12 TaxID=1797589 RepID=A0A1G1VKE1_9BACT|nr:MAG: 50S ribosomal protein L22 [Candidatus Chisholmbacteria bacterium RIFCSPHIGHO2_01_FULL_48_12]